MEGFWNRLFNLLRYALFQSLIGEHWGHSDREDPVPHGAVFPDGAEKACQKA